MALPTTQGLTTQLQNESVRNQPTTPMDGNVTRPMLIADLLKAMRDVNFSQLIEEYGSIAGMKNEKDTPLINSLMSEKERVPATPLQTETAVATGGPAQSAEEIDMAVEDMSPENVSVPTPMTDALANNTMAPLGTLTEQNDGGLMSNTPQQIA
jgi:hypothetical protein